MAEEAPEGAAAVGEKKEVEPTVKADAAETIETNGDGVAEKKEERVPIDVSKPVTRPDKGEYEAKTAALNDEVAEIKAKIEEIEAKITEAKTSGTDQSSELKEGKEALKALRERREIASKERAEIVAQQEAAKASLKTKVAATKSLRAELKYETPEKYDERIMELEKKQSTTSMSLREEKALLKEIEQLKASKKLVAALAATNSEIAADRQSTQSIGDQLKAKNGELDEIRRQYDAQKQIVDKLNEANASRREVLPNLYKEKDKYRKEKQLKLDAIRALRNEFRQRENDYREYRKELQRIRNEERKAQEEARLAEIEERRRKAEEEELKRIPYEEEMELCDYLVNFLQANYGGLESPTSSLPPAGKKTNDENHDANAPKGKGDEFEGMVLAGKAASREEDYLSLNSQLRKKKGRGKKKGGLKVVERISLVPETIEIFGVLNLEPPATLSGVADAVKQLKEKKAWFSSQERGAIPSIRDKQRAEEAKAQQSRRDNYESRRAASSAPGAPRSSAVGDREAAAAPATKDAVASATKDEKKTKKKEKEGFNAADNDDEAFPSLPGAPKPPKLPVEESKDAAAPSADEPAVSDEPAADEPSPAAEDAGAAEDVPEEAPEDDAPAEDDAGGADDAPADQADA